MKLRFFSIFLILAILCSVTAVSADTHFDEICFMSEQVINEVADDFDVGGVSNDSNINSSAFSMDNVAIDDSDSNDGDVFINNTADESTPLSIGENMEVSISNIGSDVNVALKDTDNDIVKAGITLCENFSYLLNIFAPFNLQFLFSNILHVDFDVLWNTEVPENSYLDWNSDSFLSDSIPWGNPL